MYDDKTKIINFYNVSIFFLQLRHKTKNTLLEFFINLCVFVKNMFHISLRLVFISF